MNGRQTGSNAGSHIDVLDGLRGIAIIMVVWFHVWQLSWHGTSFTLLGYPVNLEFIPVTGFMGVELFFFISGFCLFVPYARHLFEGRELPTLIKFYYRRAIKILPSYYLSVLLILVASGALVSVDFSFSALKKAALDILAHLLFMHNLFHQTYGTINGVFWSLGVEVQFYLIFPVICLLFRKKPFLTYVLMSALAISYRYLVSHYYSDDLPFLLNQLPGFLDMFANGMLAAWLLVFLRNRLKDHERMWPFFTAFAVVTFAAVLLMLKWLYDVRYLPHGVQNWQTENRFYLASLFMLTAVSGSFSGKAWRAIVANRVFVFMSIISYNLYSWHVVIARELYVRRIPVPHTFDPHQDHHWQTLYAIIAIAAAVCLSSFITYVFERPLLKKGIKGFVGSIGGMFRQRAGYGMKGTVKSMLLVIIACIFCSATAFGAGGNLVANPGFEKGRGSEPYFWDKGSWAGKGRFDWDSSVKYSGSRSISITNTEPDDSRYKQVIHVKGDTYYKFSCRIKTQDVGTNGKGANISFEGLTDASPDVTGTSGEWKLVEIYGRTARDQKSLRLTLGLGGYGSLNTGKAWFDDVVVEQVDLLPADIHAVSLFVFPPGQTEKTGSSTVLWIVFSVVTVLFSGGLIYYTRVMKHAGAGPASGDRYVPPPGSDVAASYLSKAALDKKDLAIMASMSLVYAAIALINLGSPKVPETPWRPEQAGASFVVNLGREVNLSRISYYCALGDDRDAHGRYIVESVDEPGKPVPVAVLDKDTVFAWKFIDVSAKARKLKFTVENPSGTVNEIGFFERGSRTPLKGFSIVERTPGVGNVENLFDEQAKVAYAPTYLNGTYFDEIYHARTAYEYLHRIEPFENTHPPLGKIFVALGTVIFGMNPFGWRIIGTLFGVAMVPLMYAFGKKLFESRILAFCSAFLIMFDFMHFTQTRIATIDIYGTFFIILMYYFMFDYFMTKSYLVGFRQSLRPLFFCGLSFGLGLACKWIALYGGAGLAALLLLAKYNEYKDYLKAKRGKKSKIPAWVKDFVPVYLAGTVLFCLLFFIVIPAVIYILSYIPFMMVPAPGHGIEDVINAQSFMFHYHSMLKASHPFSSPWYEWPLIIKPIWLYGGTGLPAGKSSVIVSMGNPAIWWVGMIAVFATMIIAFAEHNRKMFVVFVAMAFQYVPWMLVPRITYIYHYFSCVPFVIFSIVCVIQYLIRRNPVLKYFMWAYFALVAGLFVVYYPILSGMDVSSGYVNSLKLLKGWIF